LTKAVLIPVVFLLTGLIIFLLKPNDKQALLLALVFAMCIPATLESFSLGLPRSILPIMVFGFTSANFVFPLFFHFFLHFPETSPLLRRLPRLERYLYLPHLLVRVPYLAIGSVFAAISSELLFGPLFTWLSRANLALALAYIVGGLLVLGTNYQHANQLGRRKLRVMTAGTILGLTPWFVLWLIGLAGSLVPQQRLSWSILTGLNVAAYSALLLVPLSFAYAIVRHRVIPITLIIRRSVQYLLAKNGLRLFVRNPVP
jgi:hypothetical protein